MGNNFFIVWSLPVSLKNARISGMKLEGKRVAIVADWLTSRGGAERVIFSLAKLFPEAVVFTSVYDVEEFPELKGRTVKCTGLQRLPKFMRKRHQFLLPFFSRAFAKLDLSEFDLIISSSSSGFSKCVRKSKGAKHVCYCHTPVRFLYNARDEYISNFPIPWWGRWVRCFLPWLLDRLTNIDQMAAGKVDAWISNSNFVGERIKKYYGKNAVTIYPGVETKEFEKTGKEKESGDYFLAVGRFIPYKKFDLLIESFAKNGLKLKLAGRGSEFEKCKKMAEGVDNIEFLGFVEDKKLPDLYAGAKAFLFPAEEDFGLTPVEAMSAGIPVIYYDKGGATESVGKWGFPFNEQSVASLNKTIENFIGKEKYLVREDIVKRGVSFDEKNFREKLGIFLESL